MCYFSAIHEVDKISLYFHFKIIAYLRANTGDELYQPNNDSNQKFCTFMADAK